MRVLHLLVALQPFRAEMEQKCKLKQVKASKTRLKIGLMTRLGESWFTVDYIFIVRVLLSRVWRSEREKKENFFKLSQQNAFKLSGNKVTGLPADTFKQVSLETQGIFLKLLI